jgi:hypothetical protein
MGSRAWCKMRDKLSVSVWGWIEEEEAVHGGGWFYSLFN